MRDDLGIADGRVKSPNIATNDKQREEREATAGAPQRLLADNSSGACSNRFLLETGRSDIVGRCSPRFPKASSARDFKSGCWLRSIYEYKTLFPLGALL